MRNIHFDGCSASNTLKGVMEEIQRYSFNKKRAKKTLISTAFFVGIFLFLISNTENKISLFVQQNSYLQIIFIFWLFIFLLLLLLSLSKRMKEAIIEVDNKQISVTSVYLTKKKYLIDEIFSVETLKVNTLDTGIILGLKNKPRVIIDKYIFSNEEDFFNFFENLKNKVHSSANKETLEVSEQLSNYQIVKSSIFINVIAGLLVVLYLLSLLSSKSVSPTEDFLLLAANTQAIISGFEVYRIVSSFFFHSGWMHLGLNILVFGLIGPPLERALSSTRLINIVFIANIVAVFSSNLFSPFDASIGASGGIFGLWGALFCLKLKYEKYLPASVNLLPTRRLIEILAFELIAEIFFLSNVDYFSHIGGLITGFALVWFSPLGDRLEFAGEPARAEKVVSIALVAFYILAMCYFLYEAVLFFRDLTLSSAA